MLEGRGDAVDVFFAGGLQIDAHGNCNLAAVGDSRRPALRGPGGVGLPFLPLAGRTVIYSTSHTPRTFVEDVDFVSGAGVTASVIVTPLCVMEFAGPDHRARLRCVHPGVDAARVRSATGFHLETKEPVPVTPVATAAERDALRVADPLGLLGGAA